MPAARRSGVRIAEALAALVLHALLVVWLTWPLARHAASDLPAPTGTCRFDTPLVAWILAHGTHALVSAPAELPHGNQYHPAPYAVFYGPAPVGALALFAPGFLLTQNPALALNLTWLGGAALTAWCLHLVLWRFTVSHLAGFIGAWTFLTARWLLWEFVPSAPFYACLPLLPLVVAVAARPEPRLRHLVPLLVLQASVDPAYVTAAMLAPLAVIGAGRLLRPVSRAAGARTLAAVALTPLLLSPVYAGYAAVAARNPQLAEQTNWRALGSPLFPWLGQHLTELPWGPLSAKSPATVAPVVLLLVLAGLAVAVLRGWGSGQSRRLWTHALVWTAVGFVVSLTPAVEWDGRIIALPHAWLADWRPLRMLREPERLAIVSLIGLSLLAGLAFERCTAALRAPLRAVACLLVGALIWAQYSYGFRAPFRRAPLPPQYPTWAPEETSPELARLLREGDGALLELPVGPLGGVTPVFHAEALYRSIAHWRPVVNGYNGYWPEGFPERMALAERLPDAAALAALRQATGLTTIVVRRTPFSEKSWRQWERLARADERPDLRLAGRIGDTLVFAVRDAGQDAPRRRRDHTAHGRTSATQPPATARPARKPGAR